MKSLPYYFTPLFCVVISACARFEHQTAVSEPHALVTINSNSEFSKGSVTSIDGLPVKEGAVYRLRPGKHEIVIESRKASIERAEHTANFYGSEPASLHLSDSDQSTLSGEDMFARTQAVNLTVDEWARSAKSHSVVVLAGKRYELTGYSYSPCRISPH